VQYAAGGQELPLEVNPMQGSFTVSADRCTVVVSLRGGVCSNYEATPIKTTDFPLFGSRMPVHG